MKLSLRIVSLVSLLVALPLGLSAQEAKPAKPAGAEAPKREMPALEDVSVSGLLVKEEKVGKRKDKEGAEVEHKSVHYSVTDATGAKIALPGAKYKGADGKPVEIDALAGKQVKVSGKGHTKTSKNKEGAEVKELVIRVVTGVEAL